MYTIVFESQKNQELKVNQVNGDWLINGIKSSIDIHQVSPHFFNLLINGKSYNLEVISNGVGNDVKTFKVNGSKVSAEIRTALDELLNKMGMNKSQIESVKELKAPMPGLILQILVSDGQEITKGDPILILEAMKMENIIKSPIDGVIRKLLVKEKDSVAKNQVLIEF